MDELTDADRDPVAWREAGSGGGETVAFLHGLGGGRVAWDPQMVALARHGYRCVAWDMPGYGVSAAPPGQLTFDGLVDTFESWLDALGAAQVHVVGLSFGGMVAQHVALRMPERLRTLTLVDTSPAFGFDGTVTAAEWVEQRLAPMRTGARPADFAETVIRSIMASDAGDAAVQAGVAAMARISSEGLTAAVRCLVTHDLRGRFGDIEARTLVIVGQHDAETPLPYATYLAESIPGAILHVIAGAGHLSNLEAPEAVTEQLLAFLQR